MDAEEHRRETQVGQSHHSRNRWSEDRVAQMCIHKRSAGGIQGRIEQPLDPRCIEAAILSVRVVSMYQEREGGQQDNEDEWSESLSPDRRRLGKGPGP